jgi:hypothetical protein
VAADDNIALSLVSGCSWNFAVLTNDSDPDDTHTSLTITGVSDPLNGSAAVITHRVSGVDVPRALAYASDAGYVGSDSLTYTVSDPDGATDTATVSFNIAASTADTDADLIPDACDAFAADPTNDSGLSTPFMLDFAGAGGGLRETGFNGLMTNSRAASLSLLDDDVDLDGAGKLLNPTVDENDAIDSENLQRNALQVNVEVPAGSFTVHGALCSPYPLQQFASAGIYFGPGNQDNYIKAVIDGRGTGSAVHDVREVNGDGNGISTKDDANITAAACVDLYISVNKAALTYTPTYSLDGGATRLGFGGNAALRTVPASWLDGSRPFAVGIIATSQGPSPEISASWDLLEVTAP